MRRIIINIVDDKDDSDLNVYTTKSKIKITYDENLPTLPQGEDGSYLPYMYLEAYYSKHKIEFETQKVLVPGFDTIRIRNVDEENMNERNKKSYG